MTLCGPDSQTIPAIATGAGAGDPRPNAMQANGQRQGAATAVVPLMNERRNATPGRNCRLARQVLPGARRIVPGSNVVKPKYH